MALEYFDSPEFATLVESLLVVNKVPGLSISITRDNKVASRSFGLASVDSQTPCTNDTVYDIASSAKSLTAGAVALLVDDKKHKDVQWDATMSSMLPEDFVGPNDEFTHGVTLEDVVSHRTGMASHDSSYLGIHSKTPDNAKSITRNLRNLAVAAPLRSRYLYNNMLFTSLTHLIETKSGTSFSQYLSDRIFTPLSMSSTFLQPSSVPSTAAVATGHAWDKTTSSYLTFQSPDCPEGQGAGSIMTTSSDFILWVKALLRKEAPLSEKTVSNITKLRSFVNPSSRRTKPFTSPPFYTAGMEATYYRGATQIGHDGNIPGFASRFSFLPDHDLGIAVLTNSSTGGAVASALIRELVDEVLGVAVTERPRPQMPNQKKANAKKQQIPVRPKDEETKPKKRTPKNPQEKPLEDYTGVYSNVGYHTMTIEIRDDELYVDATDRGMGFTLTFEHVRDQTEYKAHLSDALEAGDDVLDAEFVIEDGKVVKMGVDLEPAVRDLIWFDRV